MKIRGLDELRARLVALREEGLRAVAEANAESGEQLLHLVQARVEQEFQSVESYIYETEVLGMHGGPGRYPPGTIGHFATRTVSIAGTPWEGQVQQYAKGAHQLRDRLRTASSRSGGRFSTEVGYEDGIGPSSGTLYIVQVLFGTKKMQPRPFLQVALRDVGQAHLERVRRIVGNVIRRK